MTRPGEEERVSRLEIGDVVIATEGDLLTFSRRGESVVRIQLDSDGLSELLDFLRSVRIDRQNRRRGFRVPVVSDRFQTRLGGDLAAFATRARNVSLSGIFLEFPERMPDIDIGHQIEIAIDYRNETAALSGTVTRRTKKGFGVVFEHAADARDPTPAAEFSRIMMLLEREWLAARLEP